MKIYNTILNSKPLIVHARGNEHRLDSWLKIVNNIPFIDKNSFSADVTILSFFVGDKEMSLKKQLNKYNIPYINAAPKDKNYWINTLKIKYIIDSSEDIKTPYILCLDGLDTLLSEDMSDLIDRFLSFNCDIVYNASKNSFPKICGDIEDTGSEYKYLNAGAFMGKTKAIKDFYSFIFETEMIKEYKNILSEQLRVRNGRSNYPKKDTIKVDTECVLFQTLDVSEFFFNENILKIIKNNSLPFI